MDGTSVTNNANSDTVGGGKLVGLDGDTGDGEAQPLRLEDVLVFAGLESLGTLAITGNLCLIVVLMRNRYLQRASFILMLSLAIADFLHGFVTTTFFYPPILLKRLTMPPLGVRFYNVLDWTAWSITLTHMSAICLDRLMAIALYGRYNQLITVPRTKTFTLLCWTFFSGLNLLYILFGLCCLITPLRSHQFYTFGYGEFESEEGKKSSWLGANNIFTYTYTPIELATIAILSVSNPTTLLQLYRRHKRKLALKVASAMLLEMSMRMGSKALTNDLRELAAKRASRQQQRILLQISVVAVIFYCYMTTYYLVYHVLEIDNKWVVLFNSFFYSTTHMINPIIYFSLNKEMRAQLRQALRDLLRCVCGNSVSDYAFKHRRRADGAEFGNSSTVRSKNGAGGPPTASACRAGSSGGLGRESANQANLLQPQMPSPMAHVSDLGGSVSPSNDREAHLQVVTRVRLRIIDAEVPKAASVEFREAGTVQQMIQLRDGFMAQPSCAL